MTPEMLPLVVIILAFTSTAIGLASFYLSRRDLRRRQRIEDRIDEQLHAIHEAMLLWNYGDREEAIHLLAKHDIFVQEVENG